MKERVIRFFSTDSGRTLAAIFLSLIVAFLLNLFASFSLSPLYPMVGISSQTYDNEFFLLEATLLLGGRVPYVDFYDHKGVFHVYLAALGLLIGGRAGLFLIEVIACAIAIFFLYRSVSLLFPDRPRIWNFLLVASFSFAGRFLVLNGGGHEGEWIEPWVSVSLYFLLRAEMNEERWSGLLSMFLAGVAAGLSLMSRPLDALAPFSLCFLRFLFFLKNKEKLGRLLLDAGAALLGLVPPLVLFLSLAAGGGYLDEMMGAVLNGNVGYIGSIGTDNNPLPLFLFNFLGMLAASAIYLLLGFMYRRRAQGNDPAVALLSFAGALFLLLLSPLMRYTHYLWAAFPLFIPPLTDLPIRWGAKGEKSWRIAIVSLAGLGFSLSSVLNPSLYWSGVGAYGLSIQKSEEYLHDMSLIPEEAYREGKVYVLDVHSSLYLIRDDFLAPDCPYLHFQSWWSSFSEEIHEDVETYLFGPDRPEYILLSEDEETFRCFREALLDYRPYRAEETKNDEFIIYSRIKE